MTAIMNLYDSADDVIKDLNKLMLLLDGHLIKELETAEQRKAAGEKVEIIEISLAEIREICLKD